MPLVYGRVHATAFQSATQRGGATLAHSSFGERGEGGFAFPTGAHDDGRWGAGSRYTRKRRATPRWRCGSPTKRCRISQQRPRKAKPRCSNTASFLCVFLLDSAQGVPAGSHSGALPQQGRRATGPVSLSCCLGVSDPVTMSDLVSRRSMRLALASPLTIGHLKSRWRGVGDSILVDPGWQS
jgi:hypothetical protein